jgi:hypothetical protein
MIETGTGQAASVHVLSYNATTRVKILIDFGEDFAGTWIPTKNVLFEMLLIPSICGTEN